VSTSFFVGEIEQSFRRQARGACSFDSASDHGRVRTFTGPTACIASPHFVSSGTFMKVLGFNHFNLRASAALVGELKTFYCDIVGLTVGERPPFRRSGYWLYAAGKDILHLTIADANEVRSTANGSTVDHFAFSCSGLEAYENAIQKLGVAYEVDRVPLTGQVQLFLTDPAGNGVELNFADGEG
jgi:catechol 2,3-dioxygenase-like lactoylglutathione lyase family enzyme